MVGGRRRAHLQTVEAGEQVVEEDDVAVDGEESQETRERDQEENAPGRLQARAAEEKTLRTRGRVSGCGRLVLTHTRGSFFSRLW